MISCALSNFPLLPFADMYRSRSPMSVSENLQRRCLLRDLDANAGRASQYDQVFEEVPKRLSWSLL